MTSKGLKNTTRERTRGISTATGVGNGLNEEGRDSNLKKHTHTQGDGNWGFLFNILKRNWLYSLNHFILLFYQVLFYLYISMNIFIMKI